jgi:hypothetical protein
MSVSIFLPMVEAAGKKHGTQRGAAESTAAFG